MNTKKVDRATAEDVRYAYRLILGRIPDARGLESFSRLVRDNVISPGDLAKIFLGSNEFYSRYSSHMKEVALGGFVVMICADDNDVGKVIAKTGQWEEHVTNALRENLHAGHGFLDVGANIGYFTALAAYVVGPAGHVVAIEPMDKNLQLIYATIAKNRFNHVQVHPFAAAEDEGVVCMGTQAGSSNGEVVREWVRTDAPLFAQTRRLDLLVGAKRFDVVKFDIEGYELHAWRGFNKILDRDRPVVLTEFHPKCMRENAQVEPREYAELLLRFGDVAVLHFDGKRSACVDSESLLRLWEQEDVALNTAGRAHLDLLVIPRH
ncbi:MAG: FkbM family methyltransferase [Dokdonella sp.]